jgi:hypothetical protein
MRKFYERLVTISRVLFGKNIMVIEVTQEKKGNRLAVTYWTSIENMDSQIEYLDAMAKSLKYERQEQLEKVRTFQAINN